MDGTPIRQYRTVYGDKDSGAAALAPIAAHLAHDKSGDLRQDQARWRESLDGLPVT